MKLEPIFKIFFSTDSWAQREKFIFYVKTGNSARTCLKKTFLKTGSLKPEVPVCAHRGCGVGDPVKQLHVIQLSIFDRHAYNSSLNFSIFSLDYSCSREPLLFLTVIWIWIWIWILSCHWPNKGDQTHGYFPLHAESIFGGKIQIFKPSNHILHMLRPRGKFKTCLQL